MLTLVYQTTWRNLWRWHLLKWKWTSSCSLASGNLTALWDIFYFALRQWQKFLQQGSERFWHHVAKTNDYPDTAWVKEVSEQLNQGFICFIITWVHDKYFNNHSGGLKFVKFVTNRTHHVEAIFCGIATMALPECVNIMKSTTRRTHYTLVM